MKRKSLLVMIVLVSLLSGSGPALAQLVTSFETGDLDGWTAGTNNGVVTTVNTNRASDGIYSTESSFTVPAGFAGWGVHVIISEDSAVIGITSSTTYLTLDAYTNWTNPNGWGVYGNEIQLILNYEGAWAQISPSSGSLVNGSFAPLTFDISGHAAAMSDPGLAYSAVEVVWFLGTYADNGQDNGVQTISIDNIHGNNLNPIPEPATLVLLASCAIGWCRRPSRVR